MVKRIFAALLLLLFALSLCSVALADDQRVYDNADLLYDSQIADLEDRVRMLRDTYAMDVVILTTDTTEGKATNVYCADFFESIGAGVGEGQDGVLLCIDMDNRQIMLVTHGSAVALIPSAREEAVYDDMYAYVADGDYAQAFVAGLSDVESYLAEGPEHGQFTYDTATGLITGFYYPEDAQSILQSGIEEGYMLQDEATGDYYYYPNGVPAPGLFTKERLTRVLDPTYLGFSGVVGALAGLFSRMGVKRSYKKPFKAVDYAFHDKGVTNFVPAGDKMVNRFVTTRVIPRVDENRGGGGGGGGFSGGGGGSGTFSSSSGGSFGGGGGRGF